MVSEHWGPSGQGTECNTWLPQAHIIFLKFEIFSFTSKHLSIQYSGRNTLTEGNPTALSHTSQVLQRFTGLHSPPLCDHLATCSPKLQEALQKCSCYGPVQPLPYLHFSWPLVSFAASLTEGKFSSLALSDLFIYFQLDASALFLTCVFFPEKLEKSHL